MGLDMYLKAEKYVSGYDHNGAEARMKYEQVLASVGFDGFRCEGSPSATISFTVAYWRKANQIHNWFVENHMDGNQDGNDPELSRKDLIVLRDLCNRLLTELQTEPGQVFNGKTYFPDGRVEVSHVVGRVIVNRALAEELLPTRSGFFFGCTDYDDGYISDLESTVKQLDAILNDPRFEGFYFRYHASW